MADYGRSHRALRKALLSRYVPGVSRCWRCQQPITTLDTRRIHLGHADDNPMVWMGLECQLCNLRAGGIKGNKSPLRKPQRPPWARRSRVW